jgi:hypothetical protein
MASGLVIHVEVGEERHTEVLMRGRIRIGTADGCDLRLQPSAVPEAHEFMLELARSNGRYQVADFDPSLALTLNGAPLQRGALIGGGDSVRVSGDGALALQFFPVDGPTASLVSERRPGVMVAPFIEEAAVEAAATAQRDDAKVFLREFSRELIREINWSTKIVALLLTVALVGGTLYLGFAGFRELKQSRRRLEEQNAQIAKLNDQVHESRNQFSDVTRTNNDIINSLSLAPKLRSEYGGGVCLISGMYIFVESGTGRPLRYPEAPPAPPEGEELPPTAEQTPYLTPEGNGPVAEFPYVGTGFHVGQGYVLTNRHVAAEPWSADERSMVFSSTVSGKPRLRKLLAYFPGRAQGFALRLRQVSRRDDLAVTQIDAAQVPVDLPTLPLDDNGGAARVGQPVLLMGYPSGPDRILATLPDDQADEIKQRFGSSIDVLVAHLADRKLIKPLTTQGHITDLETRRIVYDARTGQGGSGAPLFGPSGKVIGVNFAVFAELTDANFGVPIDFVKPFLERAGWKSEAPPAATTDAAALTKDGKDVKPAAAAAPNGSR